MAHIESENQFRNSLGGVSYLLNRSTEVEFHFISPGYKDGQEGQVFTYVEKLMNLDPMVYK